MLESFNTKSEMQYQRLTEEEKQKRGILGRLVGIIADFKNSTRNGRRYTEELWDKTFNDPIVKEKLENRCLFGELGHPVDRQEIDMEKIAICLAEMPKKGNDGKLYGVFDILDTPNGRILKTMCDYGCNIGVSSRGGGDTFEDFNGEETVEPDSYELECWDAVLLPAVKCARPAYVTESYNPSKNLKTALLEAVENSTEDEQKVMKRTLEELKIDYSSEEEDELEEQSSENTENLPEKVDNIDVTVENESAETNGDYILNELQESLQKQKELELQVKSLQEKVSVCYTKESRYSDKLGKANSKASAQEAENKRLSEALEKMTYCKDALAEDYEKLKAQVAELQESVMLKDTQITDLESTLSKYRQRFSTISEQLHESKSSKTALTENLTSKNVEFEKLNEAYSELKITSEKQLNEALKQTRNLETQNKNLVEELQDLRKDSQIIKSQSNAKLDKAQKLVEKYKTIAKTAVDKYIDCQAVRIGVPSSEIKARLTESYSFKDIDKAVETSQQYKLNLNSLPFSTMIDKKPVKMQIRESKEPLLELKDNTSYNVDDDIDATLLTFTN